VLEAGGFTLEHLETGPYGMERVAEWDWTIDLLQQHSLHTDLRDQVIHAIGKKAGAVVDRYPSWLYA